MTATVHDLASRKNLEASLWFAGIGWSVFPLYEIFRGICSCSAGSRCGAPGKHPRTQRGYKDATTDSDIIRNWFKRWPAAGVGIATGMSGLVVLDIDPRNRGDITLVDLQTENSDLPLTPRVLTGGGGYHFYFRKPAGDFEGFVLGQGIDVKADGGYVVAPPTLHIQGQLYRADPDAHMANVPLADLPEWIVERKRVTKAKRKSSARVTEGFLGAAAEAANWLGKQMGVDRTSVLCPWTAEHTSGRPNDGSSVIFAPVDGSRSGYFFCSHSHCANRSQDDFILALPPEALTAAREKLGMDEHYTPSTTVNPLPAPTTKKPEQWKQSLCFDQFGNLSKESGNVEILLTNDPALSGCLSFDEFRGQKIWQRSPPALDGLTTPQIGLVTDNDSVSYLQQYLKKYHNVSFPAENVRMAIENAARVNAFHPVRDYLNSLHWDRVPRVTRWLHVYLGAADTPYTRLISPWWLISAIARVYQPGCKADAVLILEGSQGLGKSTAVRILGDPWFSDTPIDIGNKDAYLTMRGRWIIELAELESLGRAEASRAKAFFSSPVDTYRQPYGRDIIEVPRQCIFVGTVNHGEYLQDETGGRRFQPVMCGAINLSKLESDKDQLWAEAAYMYHSGEVWWPTTPDQVKLCSGEQSSRYVSDEWESIIQEYTSSRVEVSVRDILQNKFNFAPKEWNRGHEMRVASCLKRLGFLKTKDGNTNMWRKPLKADLFQPFNLG